jgi:CubicO group peptidase (beta-lactamase class C family)
MRTVRLSCLAVLLALGRALVAQPASAPAAKVAAPDTPAGRALAAFVDAVSSGDRAKITAFHRDFAGGDRRGKPVPEEVVARDLDMAERSGGFELVEIGESRPYRVEAELRAKKDSRHLTISFEVEPAPPHGIMGLSLRHGSLEKPLAGVDDLKVASLDDLAKYVDARAAADRFSGVVLVSRPGKPDFVKAVGLADRASKRPVAADTRFNLGSMDKMFTAVVVAQLVEAGKLGWDDPVGKILPDYPNAEVREKVTIRHLLTHTSGLGSYWNAKFDAKRTGIRTVSDYLALFSDESPRFPPGSKFSYSNSGYIVLGAIIERVTGAPYFDVVKRHVFDRAGMTGADFAETKDRDARYAVGYLGSAAPYEPNEGELPNRGGPAGGGYSTAADLFAFGRALLAGKLVSKETLALMTTPTPQSKRGGPGIGYGFGFGMEDERGMRSIGHNGGAGGVAADLHVFPETGEIFAVLANRDPSFLMPVVERTRAALAGERTRGR